MRHQERTYQINIKMSAQEKDRLQRRISIKDRLKQFQELEAKEEREEDEHDSRDILLGGKFNVKLRNGTGRSRSDVKVEKTQAMYGSGRSLSSSRSVPPKSGSIERLIFF